jgi:hypothetical protein
MDQVVALNLLGRLIALTHFEQSLQQQHSSLYHCRNLMYHQHVMNPSFALTVGKIRQRAKAESVKNLCDICCSVTRGLETIW